jgi:methylated-DNA-[protein]-cysteine S-methyltransferase
MGAVGMALFDTAVGRCAVAWGQGGIVAVALPDAAGDDATRAGLRQGRSSAVEGELTAEARAAIDGMVALLDGDPVDLTGIRVDLAGVSDFYQRVYEVTRSIPPGGTLTYGEVAARLGTPGAVRAVGQALGRNPVPIVVPCHRVLAAGGRMGGFSAPGGTATKRRILAIEGALPPPPPTLFGDDLF